MTAHLTSQRRGIFFAILGACIYGLVPNVARLAFDQGIPALESVVVRTIIVTLAMGAAALIWKQSFRIEASARWPLALQIFATVMVSSCYIASVQFVSVGVAVLVFFTFPILIAIIAPLIEGQKLSWSLIGLALLAFLGLALALGPEWQSFDVRGLFLAGLAAVGCAMQFISGRMMSGKVQPAPFATLVHIAVLPVVTLIMLVTGDGGVKIFSGNTSVMTLVIVSLVGATYCAAYFCQMSSVANAPSSVVAPYFNIEPVVTTGIAVLLLGETMTYLHMIGGGIVLVALLITSLLPQGAKR